MKKLLTLLLALTLLTACASAWAEETTYLTYTHAKPGYTVEYPADMTCQDDSGQSGASENTESSGTVEFNAPSGANLSIIHTDLGIKLTAEQGNELILPAAIEMLKEALDDMAITEGPALCEYGGRQYAYMKYECTALGVPITCAQYYTYEDTYQYVFTLTESMMMTLPEEQMEHMLATFQPVDSAWAEETAYLTYTHPEMGYTIEYPANMICSDASAFAGQMDSADLGELGAYAENIGSNDIVMFSMPSGANLNICYADLGIAITAEQANELILPSAIEMLKEIMEDLTIIEGPVLRTYGGRQYGYLKYEYTAQGTPMTTEQYYAYAGTYQYVLTVTMSLPEEQVGHMLATFQPVD